jgi:asparagine synthase (glutamine-hydrolysing)
MPGIVGLISKGPREWAERQLQRMVKTLCHESFYQPGIWIDQTLGVYVGWVARKNSFSDRMPLRNEKGDVVLVFSGEEFPEPRTPLRLKERGHDLETKGPSYLVHLYEEDSAFPASLNGRFHGLLTDQKTGTATLFNDRYGMHRIYYHESKEAFYFAAEAKAILAVRPELRTTDPRGLGEFISCGCVLENRTLFEGIHVLPTASAWEFQGGVLNRRRTYFRPEEWQNQDPLEPADYYKEIRNTFSRNLSRYFTEDERIGMSLTGGLDTRMIMAWQNSPSRTLPCYSFGGMIRECEDVRLARQVARTCGQSHQVIPVGKEFLSRFSHYAERTVYLSDGCAGVTRSSDLYANERAAEIAPVRMTGNYGSEILRRVVAFKPVEPAPGLFCPELLSHVHAAKETYSELGREHALSFIAFRQTPWHHHGLRALEETQLSLRSPFLDNDLVRTAFRAPGAASAKPGIFEPEDEWLRLIGDGNPALRRIRTDRGLAGASGRLWTALSRSLLELTFKAEYAYDYGMPQSLARIDHFFSWFHFDRLFLGRHKFNHFRLWYRDALAQYVRETLLDQRTLSRPYLERNAVEMMVSGHLKGNRNYTSEIHTVLTLELIHRLFIDTRVEPSSRVPEEALALPS